MKAVGLIVEYNPLHNGHLHHIELARSKSNAEIVIAVMSGNFLQRGEPSIVDKFTRAKMAIEQQVNLVFELPTTFAIQHSDIFAHAAVHILNQLKVDSIVFGSEQGEIEEFNKLFEVLEQNDENYQNELKKQLNSGNNYPKASELAIEKAFPKLKLGLDLKQPNNILGLSYLKAQKKINPMLEILTIKRIQADYHQSELSGSISSATSIRNQLKDSIDTHSYQSLSLPLSSFQLLEDYHERNEHFHWWELYFPYLKYRIISDSIDQLANIHGMTEGLEYRLKDKIKESRSFDDFIQKLQTKRYTKVRLQRLLVHVLLQLTKDQVSQQLNQIDQLKEFRLLAMDDKGQAYLNTLKKTADLHVVTQLKRDLSELLKIDEKASEIYYLPLQPEQQLALRQQEFKPPIIKRTD